MTSHPAATFLDALTGGQDRRVLFQIIPDNDASPLTPHMIHLPLSQALPRLEWANQRGGGIFVTINDTGPNRRRRTEDIVSVRALAVDSDKAGDLPLEWPLDPSFILSRGSRFWFGWFLVSGEDKALWPAAQQVLSNAYNGDEIHDLPRVMRLPGFFHCKTGQAMPGYEISYLQPLPRYTIAEVMAAHKVDPVSLSRAAAPQEPSAPVIIPREVSDDTKVLVQEQLARVKSSDPQSRHKALLGWMADAVLVGMPEDEVAQEAHRAMEEMGRDPRPGEINQMLGWVRERAAAGQAKVLASGLKVATDFDAVEETTTTEEKKRGRQSSVVEDPPAAEQIFPPEEMYRAGLLLTDRGRAKPADENVRRVLEGHPKLKNLVRTNLFSGSIELCDNPPWPRPRDAGMEWLPATDTPACCCFMQNVLRDLGFVPSQNVVHSILPLVAGKRAYHPVRDYLDGLTWDGKVRSTSWLADAFGLPELTPYLEAVSRCFLIQAIARVRDPGCKVDTMLILKGPQGTFKSTAFRTLAGTEWFTDAELDLVSHAKDAAMALRGKWIIEMAELSGMRRAEVNSLKAFASRQIDRQRDPYARSPTDTPRQCVLVGTTNSETFLEDETGNRRFWPVEVKDSADLEWIRTNRDQLWAEADRAYKAGEKWWFTDKNIETVAKQVAETFRDKDPWEGRIKTFIAQNPGQLYTSSEILSAALAMEVKAQTTRETRRVVRIMRSLHVPRTEDGSFAFPQGV